jgi:hypothetical protein
MQPEEPPTPVEVSILSISAFAHPIMLQVLYASSDGFTLQIL